MMGQEGSESTMKKLYEMQESGNLCDCVLENPTENFSIPIHSLVLASKSDYFKVLLRKKQVDVRTKEGRIKVEVPHLTEETCKMLVEFLYTADVKDLDFLKVQELIPIADNYGIQDLGQLCCKFLEENLSVENCVGIHKFAKTFHCPSLEKMALNYTLWKLWDVAKGEDPLEFHQLGEKDLAEYLKSDYLELPKESSLIELIKMWIQGYPSERQSALCELLHYVRFGLFDENEWKQCEEDKELTTDKKIWSLIEHVKSNLPRPPAYILTNNQCRPRIPQEVILCTGGWSNGSPTNSIEIYDTKVNQWFKYDKVDANVRAYHGIISMGTTIYAVGGYDSVEYFNTIRILDVVTGKWTEGPPMHTGRCYVSTATLDGHIYAIGGFDGRNRTNTVEKLNPKTNQWAFVQPMHRVRSDACAGVLNEKIYVAGGFNGTDVTDTVECFDPKENTWTAVAGMHSERSGVTMVAHGEHLYVMGGFDGSNRLNSLERFNPYSNTWKLMAPMPTPRSNFDAAVIGNYIYVAGGYTGGTTVATFERYNIKTDSWESLQSMLIDRSALAMCKCSQPPNSAALTFHGHDLA